METNKNVDGDIAEARGEFIPSMREQPNYLMLLANEKIQKEKEKAMKE